MPSNPPENFVGEAISSVSISLSWTPPDVVDLNGILRGFHIDVTEVETNKNYTLQVQGTQHLVTFLHPYYTYQFTIAAITVGTGSPSDVITVRTQEDGKNN